jgi:hypothetical protein
VLLSVTQEGRGIFYFAGDLDEYNFEVLREHAAQLGPAPGAELRIKVEAHEENALREHVKDWLATLADAGVTVRVERAWSPPDRRAAQSAERKAAAAAPGRTLPVPAPDGRRAHSWSGPRTSEKEIA